MKALLLQLPVQDHDYFCSREHVPLAPAYLQAIGRANGFDVELLPKELMRYGNDQAILKFFREMKPDLIGMSCYLWNMERSLFLAREIKTCLPECRIVLGGPEITPLNDFLLRHQAFDIGVVGEGEITWLQLLRAFPEIPDLPNLILLNERGQWTFRQEAWVTLSLADLPSPYLMGCLDSQIEKVLYLETLRGCPRRCSYCNYHKQFPGVRRFPNERILSEVKRAQEHGIKEIVFLDPCFTERPDLQLFLDELTHINFDQSIHFHVEGTAETITPQLSKTMAKAGFEQIEVGLQSLRQDTLKAVNRVGNPKKFLQGVKALQESGIEVMVDLIAGLPGDRLEDIQVSLDWVLSHESYDLLMLYPLHLVPGTKLRNEAKRLGISFMVQPPYLLTRNREIQAKEMAMAFQYYSNQMEMDASALEIPWGIKPGQESYGLGQFQTRIEWTAPRSIPTSLSHLSQNGYSISLILSERLMKEASLLIPVLKEYLKENPFTLCSIEVPPDSYPEDLESLWALAQKHHHLINRDYTMSHTPFRSFLILSQKKDLLWKWPDPRESQPLHLADDQEIPSHPVCLVTTEDGKIPQWIRHHLKKRFSILPEIRRWEQPED